MATRKKAVETEKPRACVRNRDGLTACICPGCKNFFAGCAECSDECAQFTIMCKKYEAEGE